jgi:hypothetical protein
MLAFSSLRCARSRSSYGVWPKVPRSADAATAPTRSPEASVSDTPASAVHAPYTRLCTA